MAQELGPCLESGSLEAWVEECEGTSCILLGLCSGPVSLLPSPGRGRPWLTGRLGPRWCQSPSWTPASRRVGEGARAPGS